MKKNNNKWIIYSLLIVLTALVIIPIYQSTTVNRLSSLDSETISGSEWSTNYVDRISNGDELITYNDYLTDVENTPYYDYNNYLIASEAKKIAAESTSSLEAVEKTLEYVYDRVSYTYGEPDSSCVDGTAPQILNAGSGQCDTQSIVVIAILRKMGIAAKPVGGCVFPKANKYLQSVLLNSVSAIKAPVYQPAVKEGGVSLSRGVGGGLHAWAVAYIPGSGWVPLEATSGSLANTKLYNYHVELFPSDDDKTSICSSNNYDYAKACYDKNLAGLNDNGLGLMEGVSVR